MNTTVIRNKILSYVSQLILSKQFKDDLCINSLDNTKNEDAHNVFIKIMVFE